MKIYNQWPQWIQEEILRRLSINDWSQLSFLKPKKKSYWQKIFNYYPRPITKILGFKYFYDYKILNKNVLDPRYDSEIIFDILEYLKSINYQPKSAIELGAGSGCLSISLGNFFNIPMDMVELNSSSIQTLKKNIRNNVFNKEMVSQWNIIKSFWWTNVKKRYDILIVNPPYLSLKEMIEGNIKDVFDDPSMALYGGYDGLRDYEIILSQGKTFINDGIIMEICANKLKEIHELIDKYEFTIQKIFYDLNKLPRMILIYYKNN